MGTHRGNRETGRHGQGHRDGHPEDAHRRIVGPHPGPHRLGRTEDHRCERIPPGQGSADRHSCGRQHGGTRKPGETPARTAREPRRSGREESAGGHHGMREDQAGQPAGTGRRSGQGPRDAGRNIGRLRRSRRPLQSSNPLHIGSLQFGSEKRPVVRAREGTVRRICQERRPSTPCDDSQVGPGRP